MNNYLHSFPFYRDQSRVSGCICPRQSFDPVSFKLYSAADRLPTFCLRLPPRGLNPDITYNAECIYIFDCDDKLITTVSNVASGMKLYKDATSYYLVYSGEQISGLKLECGKCFRLKVDDYYSEQFWITDNPSSKVVLSFANKSQLGDVPYQTEFEQRIMIDAEVCGIEPELFENRKTENNGKETITYQRMTERKVINLYDAPDFISHLLTSIPLHDSVKLNHKGEEILSIKKRSSVQATQNDCCTYDSEITLAVRDIELIGGNCQSDSGTIEPISLVNAICDEENIWTPTGNTLCLKEGEEPPKTQPPITPVGTPPVVDGCRPAGQLISSQTLTAGCDEPFENNSVKYRKKMISTHANGDCGSYEMVSYSDPCDQGCKEVAIFAYQYDATTKDLTFVGNPIVAGKYISYHVQQFNGVSWLSRHQGNLTLTTVGGFEQSKVLAGVEPGNYRVRFKGEDDTMDCYSDFGLYADTDIVYLRVEESLPPVGTPPVGSPPVGTPPVGTPYIINRVGFSFDHNRRDFSWWVDANEDSLVRIDAITSPQPSGVDHNNDPWDHTTFQDGTTDPNHPSWSEVARFNAATPGVGGIAPDKAYRATVAPKSNPADEHYFYFTTPTASTGIVELPTAPGCDRIREMAFDYFSGSNSLTFLLRQATNIPDDSVFSARIKLEKYNGTTWDVVVNSGLMTGTNMRSFNKALLISGVTSGQYRASARILKGAETEGSVSPCVKTFTIDAGTTEIYNRYLVVGPCYEGPTIGGISSISSTGLTFQFHAKHLYRGAWEVLDMSGNIVQISGTDVQEEVVPGSNTISISFGGILPIGNYKLRWRGTSCYGSDEMAFSISSAPPVGTPPVGSPPVGTPPVGTPPVGTPPVPIVFSGIKLRKYNVSSWTSLADIPTTGGSYQTPEWQWDFSFQRDNSTVRRVQARIEIQQNGVFQPVDLGAAGPYSSGPDANKWYNYTHIDGNGFYNVMNDVMGTSGRGGAIYQNGVAVDNLNTGNKRMRVTVRQLSLGGDLIATNQAEFSIYKDGVPNAVDQKFSANSSHEVRFITGRRFTLNVGNDGKLSDTWHEDSYNGPQRQAVILGTTYNVFYLVFELPITDFVNIDWEPGLYHVKKIYARASRFPNMASVLATPWDLSPEDGDLLETVQTQLLIM